MKKFYMHVIICCLIFAYSTFSIEDMLMTENIFSVVNIINKNDTAMPCADVIIVKTREVNGVRQYRRWNVTRARWEDPYWIDIQT